jgi:hypothetical protein
MIAATRTRESGVVAAARLAKRPAESNVVAARAESRILRMPSLLEFLAVESSGSRKQPRAGASDCFALERADVVADKGESTRKVVVTI